MGVRLAYGVVLALLAAGCGSSSPARPPAARALSSVGGDFASVHYLPGGTEVVASGTLPNGQRFRVATERYRFQGRVYDDLEALLGNGGSSFHPRQMTGPLAFSAAAQCSANPELLVYGILRAPADQVAFHARRRVYSFARARASDGETVVYGPAAGAGAVVVSMSGRRLAAYPLPAIRGCRPGSLVSTLIATH